MPSVRNLHKWPFVFIDFFYKVKCYFKYRLLYNIAIYVCPCVSILGIYLYGFMDTYVCIHVLMVTLCLMHRYVYFIPRHEIKIMHRSIKIDKCGLVSQRHDLASEPPSTMRYISHPNSLHLSGNVWLIAETQGIKAGGRDQEHEKVLDKGDSKHELMRVPDVQGDPWGTSQWARAEGEGCLALKQLVGTCLIEAWSLWAYLLLILFRYLWFHFWYKENNDQPHHFTRQNKCITFCSREDCEGYGIIK